MFEGQLYQLQKKLNLRQFISLIYRIEHCVRIEISFFELKMNYKTFCIFVVLALVLWVTVTGKKWPLFVKKNRAKFLFIFTMQMVLRAKNFVMNSVKKWDMRVGTVTAEYHLAPAIVIDCLTVQV